MPQVTVVIPVFNDFVRLRTCLSSLVAQPEMANGAAQCVVVDNGSERSVKALEAEFPQVRFLEERIPGSYAARNTGARTAEGGFLAFVDSDCVPQPDWLTAILEVTERHPEVDLHVGEVELFPETVDGVEPDRRVSSYEIATAFRQKYYAQSVHFGPTANLIVRQSAFAELGGFDSTLLSGGDKEFGQRATRAGYQLRYSPECVVRHPTRSRLSELEGKTRRVVGGDHGVAEGTRKLVADLFRYAVLRPGNSLRLIWTSNKLGGANKLRASETVLRVMVWQVSERLRLLRGGEARR